MRIALDRAQPDTIRRTVVVRGAASSPEHPRGRTRDDLQGYPRARVPRRRPNMRSIRTLSCARPNMRVSRARVGAVARRMLKPERGLEPRTCDLRGGFRCSDWPNKGRLRVVFTSRNVSRQRVPHRGRDHERRPGRPGVPSPGAGGPRRLAAADAVPPPVAAAPPAGPGDQRRLTHLYDVSRDRLHCRLAPGH